MQKKSLDDEIAFQLDSLEALKHEELESVKNQLESQEMMIHYQYYEQLIEQDFAIKKQLLLANEQDQNWNTDEISMDYVTHNFTMRNGGQIIHDFSLPFNYVHKWEEYYTEPQLDRIIADWSGTSTYNLRELSILVVINIAGGKIAEIGPLLAGYSIGTYVSNFLTYHNMIALRDYGYGKNITLSDYNGLSSAWLRWTTYPHISIETEHLRKVTYF